MADKVLMETDKVWLLLCKPCTVTIKKLSDSTINQWRKRTSQSTRPYPSRKRSTETEIYNCRLLRPRRKLQFSQDAIESLPYPFDDDEESHEDNKISHEDKSNTNNNKIQSDVLQAKNVDEEDIILPAWKYKRKLRKLSESSGNSVISQPAIKQSSSLHEAAVHLKILEGIKIDSNKASDVNVNKNKVKDMKLILWKLEDMNIIDPCFQKWKSENISAVRSDLELISKDNLTQLKKSTDREKKLRTHSEGNNSTRISSDDERSWKIASDDGRNLRILSDESDMEISIDDATNLRISPDDAGSLRISSDDERDLKLSSDDEISLKLSSDDEVSLRISSDDEQSLQICSNNERSMRISTDDENRIIISTDKKTTRNSTDEERSVSTSKDNEIFVNSSSDGQSTIRQSKTVNKSNQKSITKVKRRLLPKLSTLKCAICSVTFETKEKLATHLYSHPTADLQKILAQADAQKSSDAVNNSMNVSGDDPDIDVTNKSANTEEESTLVQSCSSSSSSNNSDSLNKTASNDNVHNKSLDTTPSVRMTVCKCHTENCVQNELSVQIEMVLYCETCHILFRRNECFETHYRYSGKCNEDRRKGRLPKLFCSTCRIVLHTLSTMRKHLEVHANINFHGTVTFVCNICRVVFFGVGTVFCTHWFTHEREPTFVASRYTFPKLCVSNQGIKPAGASADEEYLFVAEYVCRVCKLQFSSENELSKHICKPNEVVESNNKIPEKPKTPLKIPQPKAKRIRVLPPKKPEVFKIRPILPKFTIPLNSEKQTNSEAPKNIVQTNSAPASPERDFMHYAKLISGWLCSYCGNEFPTLDHFAQHSTLHLTDPNYPGYLCLIADIPPSYICNLCRSIHGNFNDLMKHWSTHDIIKYYCTSCEQPYTTLNFFITHVRLSCWRKKPSCRIIIQSSRNQKCVMHFCKLCKTGFQNAAALSQHISQEHKKVSGKNSDKSVVNSSNNTAQVALNNSATEKSPTIVNSPTNITKHKFIISNRPSMIIDNLQQSVPILSNVPENDTTKQRINFGNNLLSSSASIPTTVEGVNSTVEPVQSVSLVVDDSGNFQLVQKNDTTHTSLKDISFSGSQLCISNNLNINSNNDNNNTNQTVATSNSVNSTNSTKSQLIWHTSGDGINPKKNTSNNLNVLKNSSSSISNTHNSPSSTNNKTNNSNNKTYDETKLISSSDVDSNRPNASIHSGKKVCQSTGTLSKQLNSINPIIIDSSSSDQDSEILMEKICATSNKRSDSDDALKSNLPRKTNDDTSNKLTKNSAEHPRTFLRVKNFSELLAVKNYICKRCKAAFDNEKSLNEHLHAHLNSRKGTNPTMRAALVLPQSNDTNSPPTTKSQAQQSSTLISSLPNMVGKRILPVIPRRIVGVDSRKAIPLTSTHSSSDEQTLNQGRSRSRHINFAFSCPLCPYHCNTEDALRQHLVVHCREQLPSSPSTDGSNVVGNQVLQNSVTNANKNQIQTVVQTNSALNSLAKAPNISPMDMVNLPITKPKFYNCKVCHFSTMDKQQIILHVNSHFNQNPLPNNSNNINNTNNDNNVVNNTSNINVNESSQSLQNIHVPTINSSAPTVQAIYSCPSCMNFQTTSCEALNQHIRNQHLPTSTRIDTNYYYCTQCRLYFNSDESLKNHLTDYHSYHCKNCQKRFDVYDNFASHLCVPANRCN